MKAKNLPPDYLAHRTHMEADPPGCTEECAFHPFFNARQRGEPETIVLRYGNPKTGQEVFE